MVLVACSRENVCASICVRLREEGYAVLIAVSGEDALEKANSSHVTLALIDLDLSVVSGLEVCKCLKGAAATSAIPVILLTKPRHDVDRIVGFEIGADDCANVACDPRELVLRVKAVLRRSNPWIAHSIVSVGPICINVSQCSVRVNGRAAALTATEFRLLTFLASHAGVVQSRSSLLSEVWGDDTAIDSRSIDTYLRRLRLKLGEASCHLKTVRGLGYCITANRIAVSP